jgi:hypothetical protein
LTRLGRARTLAGMRHPLPVVLLALVMACDPALSPGDLQQRGGGGIDIIGAGPDAEVAVVDAPQHESRCEPCDPGAECLPVLPGTTYSCFEDGDTFNFPDACHYDHHCLASERCTWGDIVWRCAVPCAADGDCDADEACVAQRCQVCGPEKPGGCDGACLAVSRGDIGDCVPR